jgi:PAS domain-containing protein
MADSSKPASETPTSETETQLAQSVRELEGIRYALDQSAIVATTDVTGRIKYVNDKFCEISRYSRAEPARSGSPHPEFAAPSQGVHP